MFRVSLYLNTQLNSMNKNYYWTDP